MKFALALGGMRGMIWVTTGFSENEHIRNQREFKIWGKLTKVPRIKQNGNKCKGLNLGLKGQNNMEKIAVTLETNLLIENYLYFLDNTYH